MPRIALDRELHQKRSQLMTQCEHSEKQKNDLIQQIQLLEGELKELKREETNQTARANKARQGQTLIALAAHYREAVTKIRTRAADQLQRKISEYVGKLWVEITERKREF